MAKKKSRKKLPIISLKFILTRKGEDFAERLILYCVDFQLPIETMSNDEITRGETVGVERQVITCSGQRGPA